MKKLLCIAGIMAAGLILFAFSAAAEQPGNNGNNQTSKTLIMQASWRPGNSGNSSSIAPQWQLIQFGDDFVAEENNEVVTAKSGECLFCHNFFYSEVAKLTADYKDRWGDSVNPHVYVDEQKADPHNAGQIVPDCLKCHREHALPAPTEAVFKPTRLNYCYSCHHEETFEACSNCH